MNEKEPLHQLLDILIHPTYESNELYAKITQRNEKPLAPLILILAVVRLAVQAGFTKELITTIVYAMVQADKITEPIEKVDRWVDGGYAEYKKSKDNEERRIKGLPPLP